MNKTGISNPFIITGLLLCAGAENLDIQKKNRNILNAAGLSLILSGALHSFNVERKTGCYECPECHNKYVPSYFDEMIAPHIGTTRNLKCPSCGRRCRHKKVYSETD